MPNCFQLTRKSNPSAGPVPLVEIDEELCRHFNSPCHPTQWFCFWYDIIGPALACGRTFAELRERFQTDRDAVLNPTDHEMQTQLALIVDYLDTHFTSDAWYAPKPISN